MPHASGSPTWARTTPSTRRTSIHRALLRLARALHRHPDRALRRRVPVLARAGAGARDPGRRGAPRGRSTSLARLRTPVPGRGGRRDETVGKRIRDAELEKIPYVVVYGDGSRRTRWPSASAAASSRTVACGLPRPNLLRLSLQSRSGPVSSPPGRSPSGVQPSRETRNRAAACAAVLSFSKRGGIAELGDSPLRPRRRSRDRSVRSRRPGSTSHPCSARPARRRGRGADRDQDDDGGTRVRRSPRTSTWSRWRRRPIRPSPRSWTTASTATSRSRRRSSHASTSRRSTSRRSSSDRRSDSRLRDEEGPRRPLPQPAREGEGHDHVPRAENAHPERGRDLLLRLAEDVKEIGQIEIAPSSTVATWSWCSARRRTQE